MKTKRMIHTRDINILGQRDMIVSDFACYGVVAPFLCSLLVETFASDVCGKWLTMTEYDSLLPVDDDDGCRFGL